MNARERYLAIMAFERPDRTMNWEFGYWVDVLRRWYDEGLPEQVGVPAELSPGDPVAGPAGYWGWGPVWTPRDRDVSAYFGFDAGLVNIPLENWIWPKFEVQILEEHDDALIYIDENGLTIKKSKHGPSRDWLAWPVATREDWEKLKAERFQCQPEKRLPANWSALASEYRERDYPLSLGGAMVGFFGSIRDLMGTVNHLLGYYDQPDLIHDICDFLADFWISLFEHVLDFVAPDCIEIWEDMAYKNGSMISPAMVEEFITPYYRRLTGFARDHGIPHIVVDTDGDCRSLIDPFMSAGITALYPMEVQAGMDIVEVRKAWPHLRVLGGLDKRALALDRQAIDRELETKLPFMFASGGYIPYADHLIPPDVPWENYRYYRRRLSEVSERIYG